MHNEITVSTETVFTGNIFTVYKKQVRLENGSAAVREIVEHRGGVAVLAVDEDDHVLFVRQFRSPYGEALLELPAGKLEKDEDPAACGRRELEEETGHTAADFRFLGQIYPTPGYCTEVLHLYLARGLTPTRQRLDEDEFLSVEKIPFHEALRLCMDGGIKDAKTVVSIFKYQLLRYEAL